MEGRGHRDAAEHNPLDGLPDASRGVQASLQLYVALFLILIAFFMVLNALSNQEVARRGAMLESVQAAFQGGLPPRGIDLGGSHATSEFHDSLAEIFASVEGFSGSFRRPGDGLIRAELPAASFFTPAAAGIRADRRAVLDELAATLTRGQSAERRAVEILVAVPPSLLESVSAKDDARRNLYLMRAAALARALEERAVPGGAITTGVMADDRALLWLTFGRQAVEPGAE